MNRLQVSFIIGANATGKSYFIKEHYSDKEVACLNVYDYQEKAYQEAGIGGRYLGSESRKCLYNANLMLLSDIVELLQQGRSVVVEHTLFKAKRRISYIDAIRKAVDAEIEFFVMCPSEGGKVLLPSENCRVISGITKAWQKKLSFLIQQKALTAFSKLSMAIYN